jgi:hypothetical protein
MWANHCTGLLTRAKVVVIRAVDTKVVVVTKAAVIQAAIISLKADLTFQRYLRFLN